MNEQTWQALCTYSRRFTGKLDDRLVRRAIMQRINSVLEQLPAADRLLLTSYWKTTTAVHLLDGTQHPAPLFALATNFGDESVIDRVTAMTNNGNSFLYEMRLFYPPAPGEVITAVIAHEFAHALLFIRYTRHDLPLPELEATRALRPNDEDDEYPADVRLEEALVHQIVTRWGFLERSLEFWEGAIVCAPEDPFAWYHRARNALKLSTRCYEVNRG